MAYHAYAVSDVCTVLSAQPATMYASEMDESVSHRFENQPRRFQPNMFAAAPSTTTTRAPTRMRFGRNRAFSSTTAGAPGATAVTGPSSQAAPAPLLTPSG